MKLLVLIFSVYPFKNMHIVPNTTKHAAVNNLYHQVPLEQVISSFTTSPVRNTSALPSLSIIPCIFKKICSD